MIRNLPCVFCALHEIDGEGNGWEGVKFVGNGNVKSLSLSAHNLAGTIPTEIGILDEMLDYLNT